eukprot:CAMPEP_0179017910 /NCGR_PEP_ID=MMETSP0796-20121207/4082_1 /TAXON_ID=73915 /ORGANISM="Pyrodinium bahamense, Strain pbaha01" /LENGTH=103 /DNA_ID=CAMNT_0020713653 /DNA_START=50 /DNA_END=362 /DNA_ORIENTATION=-
MTFFPVSAPQVAAVAPVLVPDLRAAQKFSKRCTQGNCLKATGKCRPCALLPQMSTLPSQSRRVPFWAQARCCVTADSKAASTSAAVKPDERRFIHRLVAKCGQ